MSERVSGERRPNILMIMADQLRADHLGFGGNEVVRTPHLDSVAESGTRFDRAYVANPVCMPNRASILTGRVPSSHGTRFNGIPLDPDATTFVSRLRDSGYRTSLVGKAHFQNIGHHPRVAERFRAGEPERGAVHRARTEGWDRWEDLERHRAGWVEMPDDYYGFGHVELAIDHADYCGGHYEHWLREQGFDPERRGERSAAESSEHWRQVYRPEMPADVYPTAWVAERSGELIEEATRAGEPFFIQVSFPDPHHPFTPPEPYYGMYDPAQMPLPPTFYADHAHSMPHVRQWSERRGEQASKMSPFAPTEEQFRDAAAKEYGAITFIDDAVGRLLEVLERTGAREDTIIVVTSDHGDMFGDQGLLLKLAMHYEGCVRVPLVLSGPGIDAGSRTAFASSTDIGPTLLDLAGVEGFHGVHGRSLRPVLEDAGVSVRDEAYIEEDEMFDVIGTGQPLRMRTLVTDEGRITVYAGTDDGEFYLHEDDPHETRNRWHDAEVGDRRAEHLRRLVQAQLAHEDVSARPTAMA